MSQRTTSISRIRTVAIPATDQGPIARVLHRCPRLREDPRCAIRSGPALDRGHPAGRWHHPCDPAARRSSAGHRHRDPVRDRRRRGRSLGTGGRRRGGRPRDPPLPGCAADVHVPRPRRKPPLRRRAHVTLDGQPTIAIGPSELAGTAARSGSSFGSGSPARRIRRGEGGRQVEGAGAGGRVRARWAARRARSSSRISRTCCADRPGRAAMIRAAAPETTAAAIEVPGARHERRRARRAPVDSTASPGAASATCGPRAEMGSGRPLAAEGADGQHLAVGAGVLRRRRAARVAGRDHHEGAAQRTPGRSRPARPSRTRARRTRC